MSELPECLSGKSNAVEIFMILVKAGWKSQEQIAMLMEDMYDKGMKDNLFWLEKEGWRSHEEIQKMKEELCHRVCGNCDKQVNEVLK